MLGGTWIEQVTSSVAAVGALVACTIALTFFGVAQAAPSPPPTPEPDPFCGASLEAIQWDATRNASSVVPVSDAIVLDLLIQGKASVDAHVTLLSDTDAYDVALHHLPIMRNGAFLVTPEVIATLPKATAIRYAYVDSYAVDGGAEVSCPSEPSDVGKSNPREFNPTRAANPRATATFKQSVPPLPCGKMFSNAQVLKPGPLPYPYSFFDHPRTVEVEVYLDSNGHVVKTSIYKSGGDAAFDNLATRAAILSEYQPALLLCVPVVSKYLFRADFDR
jgi:hypothetical protein